MRLTPDQITAILSENIRVVDVDLWDRAKSQYQHDPRGVVRLFRVMRRVLRYNAMDPWNDPNFDGPVPGDENETKRGHLNFLLNWFKENLVKEDASLEWAGMSNEEADKFINDFMKWWEGENKREKTKAVRTIDSILEIDDMKITKKELNKIIREELQGLTIKEEMDMGDQLQLDDEGKLTWDHVDMPDNLHSRTTSLWEHLNGLLQNWRPTEGESIQYKKDLFTLMGDFLKSPDRPSPGAPEDAV